MVFFFFCKNRCTNIKPSSDTIKTLPKFKKKNVFVTKIIFFNVCRKMKSNFVFYERIKKPQSKKSEER